MSLYVRHKLCIFPGKHEGGLPYTADQRYAVAPDR